MQSKTISLLLWLILTFVRLSFSAKVAQNWSSLKAFKFQIPPSVFTLRLLDGNKDWSWINLETHLAPLMQFDAFEPSLLYISTSRSFSWWSGGNTTIDKELSEDDMYALELEAFIQLIQMEKTQARIKHTLSTGKPLVN